MRYRVALCVGASPFPVCGAIARNRGDDIVHIAFDQPTKAFSFRTCHARIHKNVMSPSHSEKRTWTLTFLLQCPQSAGHGALKL